MVDAKTLKNSPTLAKGTTYVNVPGGVAKVGTDPLSRLKNAALTVYSAVTGQSVTAQTSSPTVNKVLEKVATPLGVLGTAGVLAGGYTLAAGGGAGAAAGSTGGTLAASGLKYAVPIAAAGGAVAAGLLMRSNAPQSSTQQQSQGPVYNTPTQNTTTQTYTDQSIRQRYNISNSPGASLYGAATPTASTTTAVTPSQSAPVDLGQGQSATQSQTSDSTILLLIAGAALLFGLGKK